MNPKGSGDLTMETKSEIRKRILEQRNAMRLEEVYAKSVAVFEHLCTLRAYDAAKIVLMYMDYKNEVMTGGFIKRCMGDGKRVVLPKVEHISAIDKGIGYGKVSSGSGNGILGICHDLRVYEINDVERDTLPGFKGIPEPRNTVLNRINPTEIDLAIIPGVAFDSVRNRLGYGAGFYDKFLPRLRTDCVKTGVAYSLQLVDRIPAGRYDIPMDIVFTEDKII